MSVHCSASYTLAASSRMYLVSALRSSIPLSERTAPSYLADNLCRAADVDAGRRCLQSADVLTLFVPPIRRSTLGDRTFPVEWLLPRLGTVCSRLSGVDTMKRTDYVMRPRSYTFSIQMPRHWKFYLEFALSNAVRLRSVDSLTTRQLPEP